MGSDWRVESESTFALPKPAARPIMATIPSDFPSMLPDSDWTMADLLDQLGGIPAARVRMRPIPGTATENDVVDIDDRGGPLCELVDGTLVEKPMGYYEAWLAGRILHFISNYLEKHAIGIVTGPDGFYKQTLFPRTRSRPRRNFRPLRTPAWRPRAGCEAIPLHLRPRCQSKYSRLATRSARWIANFKSTSRRERSLFGTSILKRKRRSCTPVPSSTRRLGQTAC